MPNDLKTIVWSLNPDQAIRACRALVVLLNLSMKENNIETPVKRIDVSNLDKLLEAGGSSEKNYYDNLASPDMSKEDVASAAQSMLLLAADLGFSDQVMQATRGAQTHVRDFGFISGPLILAGLAVVLSWVPVESRNKVTTINYKSPEGTELKKEVTESVIIRAGPAAVEKVAGWWKYLAGG